MNNFCKPLLLVGLFLFFSACNNKSENDKVLCDSINTDTTATAIAIEEVLSPSDEVKTVAEQIKFALTDDDIPKYESLIAELKEYGESLSLEELMEFLRALTNLEGDYGKEMEKLTELYQNKANELLEIESKKVNVESIEEEDEQVSIRVQEEYSENENGENSNKTIN